jgi:hypothetical protein
MSFNEGAWDRLHGWCEAKDAANSQYMSHDGAQEAAPRMKGHRGAVWRARQS